MSASARYVAIITDGNGRWARKRNLPVLEGHRAGADIVKERLRDAVDLGIEELTVYSFSTENWSRSHDEVSGLMRMFAERIKGETPELHEEGVRMRFIGRRRGRPRARRPDGVGREHHGGQPPHHALRRLQLRAGGDHRRGAKVEGGSEEDFRRHRTPPRHARPRPDHPHERRAAAVQLPAVAGGLFEFVFRDELWPDFSRAAFAPRWPSSMPAGGGTVTADGDLPPASALRRRLRAASAAAPTWAPILWAIPLIAFAVFIVVEGGLIFALGVLLVGILCMGELFEMLDGLRSSRWLSRLRADLAASTAPPATCCCWWRCCRCCSSPSRGPRGGPHAVDGGHAARGGGSVRHRPCHPPVPPAPRRRDHRRVLNLPRRHAAYVGAAFGRRCWRPSPPKKTSRPAHRDGVRGVGVWFAGLYQDWLSGVDAVLLVWRGVRGAGGRLFEC